MRREKNNSEDHSNELDLGLIVEIVAIIGAACAGVCTAAKSVADYWQEAKFELQRFTYKGIMDETYAALSDSSSDMEIEIQRLDEEINGLRKTLSDIQSINGLSFEEVKEQKENRDVDILHQKLCNIQLQIANKIQCKEYLEEQKGKLKSCIQHKEELKDLTLKRNTTSFYHPIRKIKISGKIKQSTTFLENGEKEINELEGKVERCRLTEARLNEQYRRLNKVDKPKEECNAEKMEFHQSKAVFFLIGIGCLIAILIYLYIVCYI